MMSVRLVKKTDIQQGLDWNYLSKWNLCSRQHGFAITALHSWRWERLMNNVIWLVGAIVIVLFRLGFLGPRQFVLRSVS
jgi:hypothetical protein